MTAIHFSTGNHAMVTETPEAIAAMLAEPVADDRTPADLAVDSWRATVSTDGQPDRELVGIEPLDGAGVRELPTPHGARRFLCLPECDLAKPADNGKHLVWHAKSGWTDWHMCERERWTLATNKNINAAFGPLPPVAP